MEIDDANLNAIPENQTDNFDDGISEDIFETKAEMDAFLHGLSVSDAIDVYRGTPFQREGKYVVRVCVGDW